MMIANAIFTPCARVLPLIWGQSIFRCKVLDFSPFDPVVAVVVGLTPPDAAPAFLTGVFVVLAPPPVVVEIAVELNFILVVVLP